MNLSTVIAWLRKPAKGQSLVAPMEGLRFIALLSVFMLHYEQALQYKVGAPPAGSWMETLARFCGIGQFGVQLFFAVSGFVLALPFARSHLLNDRPVSLRSYFLRRLWRLEPPLLINLVLVLPLAVWLFKTVTAQEAMKHFLLTISYLHYVTLGQMSPINHVTWSLETEAQFYCAMPLLGLLFRLPAKVQRRTLLVLLALLCVAAKPWVRKALLPAQFEYFAIGILLADLYLTDWAQQRPNSRGWDLAGLAAWVLMPVLLLMPGLAPAFLLNAGLAILVFVAFGAALRGRWSHRLASGSVITLIGGMCYSFYLYHHVFLRLTTPLLARLPGDYGLKLIVGAVLCFIIVLAMVLPFYAAFERPFMNRRRKNPGTQGNG